MCCSLFPQSVHVHLGKVNPGGNGVKIPAELTPFSNSVASSTRLFASSQVYLVPITPYKTTSRSIVERLVRYAFCGFSRLVRWNRHLRRLPIYSPFDVRLVEAGSRVGYRWISDCCNHPYEVIWLDPEPHRESIDYDKYIEELQEINLQVNIYRGFHQPPTE